VRYDESLVAQVAFKTTGANAHTVRCVVMNYINCSALSETENVPAEARLRMLNRAIELERQLRVLVATGSLPPGVDRYASSNALPAVKA